MNVWDGLGWIFFYDVVYYGNFNCVLVLLSVGVDLEVEMDDFMLVIEMIDDDKMFFVVGRVLILVFNSGY